MSNPYDLSGPTGRPGPVSGGSGTALPPMTGGAAPSGQTDARGVGPLAHLQSQYDMSSNKMPDLLRQLIAQYGQEVGTRIFEQMIAEMNLYGDPMRATGFGGGGMDAAMLGAFLDRGDVDGMGGKISNLSRFAPQEVLEDPTQGMMRGPVDLSSINRPWP